MNIGRYLPFLFVLLTIAAAPCGAGEPLPPMQWAITEMHLFDGNSRLKGEAVVVFNRTLAVRCAVSGDGRRVFWPARRENGGAWAPQVSVLDGDLRGRIERAVLARIDRLAAESGRPAGVNR